MTTTVSNRRPFSHFRDGIEDISIRVNRLNFPK